MNYFLFLRVFLTTLISFFVLISCSSEKKTNRKNLTFVFYNVENLFDTSNDERKDDSEFLPGSDKKWTTDRYTKKLEDISKVLSSVNDSELPEIIGLCEVENREVVTDLVKTGKLSNGKYQVVHFESPDTRGIDCALVYRPDEFSVISQTPVIIRFENSPRKKTRDILYVKGKTLNREEFHIFVNHWPSRVGGNEETEPDRVYVASVLKSKIDSVIQSNSKANIVVMGDMNDEPANKSLNEILGAKNPGTPNSALVNLMFPDDLEKKGSYYYSGDWNMLDNIVVSDGLLDNNGFQCKTGKGYIFHEEWMEFRNSKGQATPNRTYGGSQYYGGVSDHFPVYFQLVR